MNLCKVLFLAANPKGTTALSLDHEIREIEEKIRLSEHRDTLKIISKWALRPDDLLQALNEHSPHVVHFSGHGSEENEIILLDDDGDQKQVSSEALAELFRVLKDNISLVVLNACYSQGQAKAIVEHVDCAVGMNTAVGDDAAITFAASFYRALGFGRSIQQAFDQGKAAVMLESIPEHNTPELLVKSGVDPNKLILVDPTNSKQTAKERTMADKSNRGVNIGGNVVGGVFVTGDENKVSQNVTVGGDMIGGDKVATTTNYGFQQQDDKDEFLKQLDQLRSELRQIKAQIDNAEQMDEDAKDELVMELLATIKELKSAKEEAAQIKVGEAPPAHKVESVGQKLDKASGILESIEKMGETVSSLSANVAPIVKRVLPIIAAARLLIGLP